MQTYTLDIRNREITLASDDSTLVRTASGVDVLELLFHDRDFLDGGYDLRVSLACDGAISEVRVPALYLAENPNEEDSGDGQEEEPPIDADDEGPTDEEDDPEYDPEPDIDPEYDDEPEPEQWVARAYIIVPDEILEHEGALGVTVHGANAGGDYIVTALSEPLEIMHEGEDGGESPQPSPYRG